LTVTAPDRSIVAVGAVLPIETENDVHGLASSSLAQTCTVHVPLSPYVWLLLNVSVAFGRPFSSVPLSACTALPSPHEMVPDSGSSQPGSVTVPNTVTEEFSLFGVSADALIVGATLSTFTVAVSSSVSPTASVTQSFTVVGVARAPIRG
jgi:hypothetical protein